MSRLQELDRTLHALNAAVSLMNWDRQVLMPKQGGSARGEHVATLMRLAHAVLTGGEMDAALAAASAEEGALVRTIERERRTRGKLPAELVERKARAADAAYDAWRAAKPANDFGAMLPHYQRLFEINREMAERLGYAEHPYDALIDLFDEGATKREAEAVFAELRPRLKALIAEVRTAEPVSDAAIADGWDPERLRAFAQETAAAIGFDFGRGRLDLAYNAFCTNLGPGDVRMTTRPTEHLRGVFSSSLHEMGHALYEQNIDPELGGSLVGTGVSLAVHESQSRMWENLVARSRPFWTFAGPRLRAAFSERSLPDDEGLYRALNVVEPGFIRVGADEVTYNLHILLRFELEVALIEGSLSVADLPDAWNAKMTELLGVTPRSDAEGCLQDVHWSRGSVGYFPTYTYGNLLSGQIWHRVRADLPDLDERMAHGDFQPLLEWLRDRIYRHGRRMAPRELVLDVVGAPMRTEPWLDYIEAKVRDVYGLA